MSQLPLSKEEQARRMDIYSRHEAVREMAKEAGLSTTGWHTWMNKNGLKAKCRSASHCIAEDERKRRMLAYDMGDNDEEMAEIAGLPKHVYSYWRKKEGLPAKRIVKNRQQGIFGDRKDLFKTKPPDEVALIKRLECDLIKFVRKTGVVPKGDAMGRFLSTWASIYGSKNLQPSGEMGGLQ